MGWPVAYRRSAPVRSERGIQAVANARRSLSPASTANARTPVSDIQKQIEAMSPALVRGALDYLGVPGRVAGLLWDLYDQFNPPGVSAPGTAAYYMPGNWTVCSTPSAQPCIGFVPTHYGGSQTYPNNCNGVGACTQNLTLGGINPLPVSSAPWARIHFVVAGTQSGKWTVTRQMLRTSSVQTQPQWQTSAPQYLPQLAPVPEEIPWTVDPMTRPIGQPGFDAAPLPYWLAPYRQPNEWRSPVEQTWRGPLPAFRPAALPEISPGVRAGEVGKAGPTIVVGANGVTLAPPSSHSNPRPPKPYTKERKVVLAVGGVVAKIANIATESKDFVEAIWKALPKKMRTKPEKGRRKITVQAMLWDIYRHFGDVDLPKAMSNIVQNELQDRLYGKAGQYAKSGKQHAVAAGYDRTARGYQLGDRYRPQANAKDAYRAPDVNDYLPSFTANDAIKAIWH